jgi:hypothetical protein
MPQKTNLNVSPYYDDFNLSKNFYKVLFRPGYAIQGRELTTLQSILQNQIESFGKNVFKQGDMIIPGQVSLNTKLDYVKLSSISQVAVNINGNVIYQEYDITQLEGFNLIGLTSGVSAIVLKTQPATSTQSSTIFVKYVNSGDSYTENTFRQGETLTANIANSPTLVVGTDGNVFPTTINRIDGVTGNPLSPITSPAMGYASAVNVEEGIYFANGFFVQNQQSLFIIDPYYNNPTCQVGFVINEKIITPEEDFSLYDNSIGSSNYTAPGAHRFQITLDLVSYDYNQITDANFIKLISILNGIVQKIAKPIISDTIEEVLAKRTYDESGDFVIDNFSVDIREYYQQNNNKGLYTLDATTNLVNGKSLAEADASFVVGIGPGKAYVKGYEILNKETKYLPIEKARTITETPDNRIKITDLPSYNITNVYGSVPLNSYGDILTVYPSIYLCGTFNDGSIGTNGINTNNAIQNTINRRGKSFGLNDGIKTFYLDLNINLSYSSGGALGSSNITFSSIPSNVAIGQTISGNGIPYGTTISNISNNIITLNNTLTTQANGNYIVNIPIPSSIPSILYYIKTRGSAALSKSISVLSYKLIIRTDISLSPVQVLELTVLGDKFDLTELFLEYDEGDFDFQRKLYLSSNDANTNANCFGYIVDYNDTITPVIGITKPKNFSFIQPGSGFNSNINKILSKGSVFGNSVYNGLFSLSYFNPTFFTKIILDEPIFVGFSTGQTITGLKSGAFGVIENSTDGKYSLNVGGNLLFVRTLSGTFLSGETIIDEKGNSQRIAKENTISYFIVVNGGSNYTTNSINTLYADNVKIDASAVKIFTNNGKIYKVAVQNRNILNTVYDYPPKISIISFVGDISAGSGAIIIPVLYRNTVTTYGSQDVKSLYSSYNNNVYQFTADIDYNTQNYYSTTKITNYPFSGKSGQKYLECIEFAGDATPYLKQGDIIQFVDVNNNNIKVIVQYATKPQGSLKSRIYLDSCLTNDVSSSVSKISAEVENSKSNLLVPTGSQYVNSIINDVTNSQIKYYIRRDFVINTSNDNGDANITFAAELNLGTQTFVPFNQNNFIVTVLNDGGSSTIKTGDILYIDPNWVSILNTEQISGLTSGTFTLSIPSGYFGTGITYNLLSLKLTGTLEISNVIPRIKTLHQNKQIVISPSSNKIIILRGQDYNSENQNFISYSDVIKINFIYEGTTSNNPVFDSLGNLITGTDVTERFSFDDGQRDTFYDISKIVLKPGYDLPTGILVISFDYFEHSQGDFCTVDSYLHESGISIDNIPYFNSSTLGKVSLRDVIDFRPKVDTTTISSGFQNESIVALSENPNSISTPNYCSFIGSGGVVTNTPATDVNLPYTIEFNMKQYLNRIDSVILDKKGNFSVNMGSPSINPVKPQDIQDAITLFYLYIPSYTNTISDIKYIPVNNKRYTMKDIGKIEQRIDRLEKYTQLSILEQQALNTQIQDEFGIDRIKTGFIVDNFENHSIGNLISNDYQCAIDSKQSVLRPKSFETSVDLIELYNTDNERNANNYKNTNGIVTLSYINQVFIKNLYATNKLNPNPFDINNGQYVGDIFLFPPIDQWFDRNESPVILNNDSSIYSIFFAKNIASEAFDSIFNAYLLNWIGVDRSFYNIDSLSSLSSVTSKASVVDATIASNSNISPENNELTQGTSNISIGNANVVTSLKFYARSKYVGFKLNRMKPNTNLYVFIDGTDIGRWIIPDINYTGIPGNSLSTFGSNIKTDLNGNASGFILIPSGYPPLLGSFWQKDFNLLTQDTSYQQCYITSGNKTIRFTSSSINDTSAITLSETKYYATGILPLSPSTISSTIPSFSKANDGIQLIQSSSTFPNPLSQTFEVQNAEGGIFVTGIDLFFNQKSNNNLPVKVYLTDVDSGVPGKNIIPGTEVVKFSNTYIRVYTNGSTTFNIGETITGSISGASGPLSSVTDVNNNIITVSNNGTVTLQTNKIYILVLNNNNGISFNQNEFISSPSLTSYNQSKTTPSNPLKVKIVEDSGRITNLKLNNFGKNYQSASIVIGSPDLFGGSVASGTVSVSNGQVFDVFLSSSGSGYTQIPSVIINGTGDGATGALIEAELTIDTPAVIMGVAIDPETIGVIDSTTPTHFEFDYPVYLQNNTYYSLVVETDSNKYQLWSSRLGEIDIITNNVVTTQPLLGSVYRTQNVNNWSEDLSEDIKFTLYQAKFNTSVNGNLYLVNNELGYELLKTNPIETNNSQDITATSTLFKNNNKIVKIYHPYHGFEDFGSSIVNIKRCQTTGGISADVFNQQYFTVNNAGINYYTINCGIQAGNTVVGGGSEVLISHNKKFEKIYPQISCLNFSDTNINTSINTTNIVPFDSKSTFYNSYSQEKDNQNNLLYETTFLNQEHYFTNQKVICSRINEINNNISNSITYKLELSSSNSNLSPVIDTRFASIKIVNNLVEKSTGQENRFAKRNQNIKFYPIYIFAVDNYVNVNSIAINQTVTGSISGASGIIVENDSGKLYVRITTTNVFQATDVLTFSVIGTTTATISKDGITLYQPNFIVGSIITALSPTNISYDNLISGKIVAWDSENAVLTVSNNKNPINGDFESPATITPFVRTTTNQVADIFRVGDVLTYQGIISGQERFIQISSIDYTNGIDYVPENFSSNSSSVAKYVTKEIVLQNPSTTIDVRLTANLFELDDVLVFYKINSTDSQINFDDLNWYPFNNYGESDTVVIPSAENYISGLYEKQSSYKEYKYSVSSLSEFSSYAIKIVMTTSNPSFVPKIQNMRAIASY